MSKRVASALHWDQAYLERPTARLGWYEPVPTLSIELIQQLELPATTAVIDVGGGAATLVDHLLCAGFEDITVLDISQAALDAGLSRVGENPGVTWLHEDLLQWTPTRKYGLWHDRAVLHFLTDAADRDRYVNLMKAVVEPGGAVVIGVFAADGPRYCSGLPVVRYSPEDLRHLLGDDIRLVTARRELHTTPQGVSQPFTWISGRRL